MRSRPDATPNMRRSRRRQASCSSCPRANCAQCAISTLANFGIFFGGRDSDNRNPLVALVVLILAPIAAVLIQLAISRGREYEADRGGAELSGDPRALADALAKIDRYAKGLPLETAEAHPATAHMMIINPLSGGGLSGLFSTHPPTEERIHRLLAMAG